MLRFLKHTLLSLFISLGVLCTLQAQQTLDLSGLNYREMSAAQLEQLSRRAAAMGYNQSDLLQAAKSQGLSAGELNQFGKRLRTAKTLRASQSGSVPVEDSRLRQAYKDSLDLFREIESDIFGLEVFRGNRFLTFQSNLNMPTPADYVLGPGDQLYIDLYGQSEAYYQAAISPEGTLILENFGPIPLSGLTVSAAKKRLTARLSSVYQGLRGTAKNTQLNISVGTPRTVRVNVVGEVALPGTYHFSAFNTVYNALYVAGGLTENASLRAIRVYRNNQLVSVVDVYKYLISGDASADIRLENNDLILVGPYTQRVSLEGAVKTEGRFELTAGESLQDLLDYAGGFHENAYTGTLKVTRVLDGERVVADVHTDQFAVFLPQAGDVYRVQEVLDRYRNRVIVQGAVYRPGNYAITAGMGVKDLVEKTDGLRPEALTTTAYIIRTNDDLSTTTLSFKLGELLQGRIEDIPLQPEDVLNIISKHDLREELYLEVAGAVNQPGTYPFSEGMTLRELLLMSGGFTEAATACKIEVTRRVSGTGMDPAAMAEVMVVDMDKDFTHSSGSAELILQPFDHITVRKNPNFFVQEFVSVEGEVHYPGKYAITSKNEKISDLLQRAGGLNDFAYTLGATLIRRTEFYEEDSEEDRQMEAIKALQKNLLKDKDTLNLSEASKALLNRIEKDLEKGEASTLADDEAAVINYARERSRQKVLAKNDWMEATAFPQLSVEAATKSTADKGADTDEQKIKETESIGIALQEILRRPGGPADLQIREGDILVIPKKQETVRLRGALLHPTTVRYRKGRSLKHYINNAGGFENDAKRSRIYVIYPNGSVDRTKKILFFNRYPKIQPGSEIIVPIRPERKELGISNIVGLTSGLATLILALSQLK